MGAFLSFITCKKSVDEKYLDPEKEKRFQHYCDKCYSVKYSIKYK